MSTSAPLNRLADETSPYLLQHARNPVHWQPWDDAALSEAKRDNKPIFLSIGYSACHWCHVMEHESFENEDIATLMNQWFVNIKVDREERPDLDQIYMNAVMAMTGSGGWPMSVFLTPDLQPFFGGTYWPPESKWGRPGFGDILKAVNDAWDNRREAVIKQAAELTQAVIQAGRPSVTSGELSVETLQNAQRSFLAATDKEYGGFGAAPKFPHAMCLRVLLRCYSRFHENKALEAARLTLDKMAAGGIYDQLGGGFARYSTDERWLVPHFEKMLYDNALLVPAYLEAFQLTHDAAYERVIRETLDYTLREMTRPGGGFYSSQDADSEGVEGKFFVWSQAEILELLGAEDGPLFCAAYDVTPGGNWEHTNILNRPIPWSEIANQAGLTDEAFSARMQTARQKLLERRSLRIAPGRDEKILTSWNGLMIAAMAQAGFVLDEPRYLSAAREAADFILREMRADDGRLWHAYKDGRARFNGYLDDYAALIDALTELYQAAFETRYLEAAISLTERMRQQFRDPEDAGYFYTSDDHESLITRNKEIHDNATPSGNSLAATALVKLGRLTGRTELEDEAAATLNSIARTLQRAPIAGGQSLIALDLLLGPTYEIVMCGDDRDLAPAMTALRDHFLPNKLIVRRPAGIAEAALPESLKPLLEGKQEPPGDPNIYVCERGSCHAPKTVKEFVEFLAAASTVKGR